MCCLAGWLEEGPLSISVSAVSPWDELEGLCIPRSWLGSDGRRWGDAETEGDDGTCKVPASARCCGGWRGVEDANGGEIGCGVEVAAEEGSVEDVPRELGARSGREE